MISLADQVNGLAGDAPPVGMSRPLILLTLVMDDSCSMKLLDNWEVVMNAHNGLFDDLAQCPRAPAYLAKTRYLNRWALADDYRPLTWAPRITPENYVLSGGTPLFFAGRATLRHVKRQVKYYRRQKYDVRTITLFLSDGYDRDVRWKRNVKAEQVSRLTQPMIATGRHIIGAFGVAYPGVNFFDMFISMGIPRRWIWSLRSHEEIRQGFKAFGGLVSSSSMGPKSFGETLQNGFETHEGS